MKGELEVVRLGCTTELVKVEHLEYPSVDMTAQIMAEPLDDLLGLKSVVE